MAWHSLASRWAAADFASSSGTTIEVATLRRTRHVRSNRRCTRLGYPWLPDEARGGPLARSGRCQVREYGQRKFGQGGDFTKPFLKYFKNGSEKPVFISFSLHFTIVDYYPPSFHFILTMRVFGENGFFWINWKGRVKSLGKVSNRATYLS